MNNRVIQKRDLAGKMKLTAVTIGARGRKQQFFAMLEHNAAGEAILPMHVLDKFLDEANVRRGDTYTVG